MTSTAPVLAPSLPSRRSHRHSIAAKTKAPDDDCIGNDGVGMVVVVVAASGTIAFVPVNRRPPRLVDDQPLPRCHPIAVVDLAPQRQRHPMMKKSTTRGKGWLLSWSMLSSSQSTTLPSCRRRRRYSAAKTKALDDDNIDDNRQGMVVVVVIVVVAMSAATVAFAVPVTFAFAVAVAVATAVALVVVVIIPLTTVGPPFS
jgi:hypothetical protein